MYAVKIKHEGRTRGVREDLCLRDALVRGRKLDLRQRVTSFSRFLQSQAAQSRQLFMRKVVSAADREVVVEDPYTGRLRKMLMFGSNNYLGLANHPYVRESAERTISRYGVGVGGPPLLNGYTGIHHELEERIAHFKGAEDAILFPTGYQANLGMISGLTQEGDVVLYDALSHASFRDGLQMTRAESREFPHNRIDELEPLIDRYVGDRTQVFVGVEGVYSMDGDLAPLDEIVALCRRRGAILMVDDAHGTGVVGRGGHGTASHYGVDGDVDVTMGTFSKVFAVTGGFVAASKPIVSYLRFFARSHMFSASISPMVVAAVLAGFDVMEFEPDRMERLRSNVRYLGAQLKRVGVDVEMTSPILALRVPVTADVFAAARTFHDAGLFVNPVIFPAVPAHEQRFRISLMATHTRDDLDRLVACVGDIVRKWRGAESNGVSQ
jgi:glycine C-acetyltransferase